MESGVGMGLAMPAAVGAVARALREAEGVSMEEVGRRSGFTGQTVRNVEQSMTGTSLSVVFGLARAFGIDASTLVFMVEEVMAGVDAAEVVAANLPDREEGGDDE